MGRTSPFLIFYLHQTDSHEIDSPKQPRSIWAGLSMVTEYSFWYSKSSSAENVLSRSIVILAHWWIQSFSDFLITVWNVLAIIAINMLRRRIGMSVMKIMNTIIVMAGVRVIKNSSYCKNCNRYTLFKTRADNWRHRSQPTLQQSIVRN